MYNLLSRQNLGRVYYVQEWRTLKILSCQIKYFYYYTQNIAEEWICVMHDVVEKYHKQYIAMLYKQANCIYKSRDIFFEPQHVCKTWDRSIVLFLEYYSFIHEDMSSSKFLVFS